MRFWENKQIVEPRDREGMEQKERGVDLRQRPRICLSQVKPLLGSLETVISRVESAGTLANSASNFSVLQLGGDDRTSTSPTGN